MGWGEPLKPRRSEAHDLLTQTKSVLRELNLQFGTLDGEGYGAGIQKGGSYWPDPSFRAFDILVGETWWQEQQDLSKHLLQLGIPSAPLWVATTMDDMVDFVSRRPHSNVASLEGPEPLVMEGIVARPEVPLFDSRGKRVMVKLKVSDLT